MYIGQTIRSLAERKAGHLVEARNGKDVVFHRAIRKYGEENFKWEIIDYANDQNDLNRKEEYWICKLNTYTKNKNSKGYNMTKGASKNGVSMSEETKEKIREKSTGRKHSEKTKKLLSEKKIGKNNPRFGVKMTDKEKQILSDRLTGKIVSNSHRNNLSIALKNSKKIKRKAVVQLTKQGEFIKIYESCTEVAIEVTNKKENRTSISACCKGKLKTALGYIWVYKEDYDKLLDENTQIITEEQFIEMIGGI